MRALEANFAARLATPRWSPVRLVELQLEQGTYRYAFTAGSVTFNGEVFSSNSGFWTEQQETLSPEAPLPKLIIQNVDEVLGPVVDLLQSGYDVRGRKVKAYITDATAAAASPTVAGTWVEESYWIQDYHLSDEVPRSVVLALGVWPAVAVKVPWRLVGVPRCPWVYKGKHCGFQVLPDGTTLAACDKTIDDCMRHFPGLPIRTGQFLSRDVLPRTLEV